MTEPTPAYHTELSMQSMSFYMQLHSLDDDDASALAFRVFSDAEYSKLLTLMPARSIQSVQGYDLPLDDKDTSESMHAKGAGSDLAG